VDSGVETVQGPSEAQGEKRKDIEEDELEKKRLRKAAKKARKERERQEAWNASLPQANDLSQNSINDNKKSIDFEGLSPEKGVKLNETRNAPSPEKGAKLNQIGKSPKPKGPQPIDLDNLPEGFSIVHKETEKKKWKEYLGPDGKKYRSLNDIKKRFVDCIDASPNKGVSNSSSDKGISDSSPKKSFSNPSPKKGISSKKQISANILEAINNVAETWNIGQNGELAENHPKYLAYSSTQINEMDPFSKMFWINPEKRKRPKKVAIEDEKVESGNAPEENPEEVVSDVTVGTESLELMMEHLTESERRKKKPKKLKHREADVSVGTESLESLEHLTESERKKKKKKKNKHKEAEQD